MGTRQLELCKKLDEFFHHVYENRNILDSDETYFNWNEVLDTSVSPIDVSCLRDTLINCEKEHNVVVTEEFADFLGEFSYCGTFYNHVSDYWQETIRVFKHKPTLELVGVRSVYSSWDGPDIDGPNKDGFYHVFPVRPIQSWDYGESEEGGKE